MLIELQNFGPIKSFQFDTSKDIHAIFGKNNIGKSYAISAVYLILKSFIEYDSIQDRLDFNKNFEKQIPEILKSSEEIYEKDNLDITKKAEVEIFDILNYSLVMLIDLSFKNSYDFKCLQNQLNPSSPTTISIKNDIAEIIIGLDKYSKNLILKELKWIPKIEIVKNDLYRTELWERLYNKYDIYSKSTKFYRDEIDKVIEVCVNSFVNEFGHKHSKVYFLPASRSGLYNALNSFGAIFAELSRNRNFIRQKIEIPNISEPISDYFLRLNTIDKAQVNEKYVEYFEEIEKDILKGTITLDTETKKYFYAPQHSEIKLELSFTSSMISEIAPIIAHLKYIIPFGDKSTSILFIEEPEAHLHPEVQVALLNFFVKLSKANVKIVMTSHSNYIFNKLSNLIIAKEIQPENISISLMKMTNQGSVIEDGGMAVDEYGIEDNNFVDIAEQLYDERMQLLEKL